MGKDGVGEGVVLELDDEVENCDGASVIKTKTWQDESNVWMLVMEDIEWDGCCGIDEIELGEKVVDGR